jgi:hypothetical protein
MTKKLSELTIKDLHFALKELGEKYSRFDDDDLFVMWFLRAYVTDNEDRAAESITGGSNDKGLDAIMVDDASRAVIVVQGKYRKQLLGKTEVRNDVMAFADLADFLHLWSDEECQSFLADADHAVAERLRTARKKVHTENYRTWLYFVTTGKVSPTVRKDALQKVRKAGSPSSVPSRMEVIDGKRAMLLFRDYLDGVAPPIPTLDLEMESGDGITVNGVAQRFDQNTKVESWVFSMRGDAVARLYEKAGLRLFARNIRGFMGMKTPVNQGMVKTLQSEADKFFYYNNGITIVCDDAERKASQGRDIMTVGNPQVINGQQTTRTLAAHPQLAAKASVLVKVIRVPRDVESDGEVFDDLISRIVAGTNWQNAIKQSDLMSNDRRQIELERALRKVGYFYLRKRQNKGESKAMVGKGQFFVISKEELAQASAGCDFDPYIIRSGMEKLFGEDLYGQIFPNSDPDYYLPRYRLMREVTWASKGTPERGYTKWMVLHFVWSHVSPLIKGKYKSQQFRRMCEKQIDELVVPLNGAINLAFEKSLQFYRAERGTGSSAQDISTFFRSRRSLQKQFASFWKSLPEATKKQFDRCLSNIGDAITSFSESHGH